MIALLYTALLLFSSQAEVIHDLHLSKTDIEYNESESSLEITIHIYIDDLEIALSEKGHQDLRLCTLDENELSNQFISEYINDKMKLYLDQEPIDIIFLGKEESDDLQAVWCYIEVPISYIPEVFKVELDFFNELYDDQKNVLRIEFDKDHKGYFLLNSDTKSGVINF